MFDVGGLPEERVELPEHRLTPEGIRVEGEEPPKEKEKEENEPPMDADKRR